MPDEILAFTLSLLPIREAARTSILSSRWRYLWKDSVALSSALNLDVLEMRGSDYPENFFGTYENWRFTEKRWLVSDERLKFVDWVDRILTLHSARVLDSFRIRYYFRKKKFARLIDEWLRIATTKKVKNYDINLSHFSSWGDPSPPDKELYKFPNRLFTQETVLLIRSMSLNSCGFKPLDSNLFTSLLELQLEHVFIGQANFVTFLSNCPNLEKLYLTRCYKIHKLDIRGSLPKLKHLALSNCRGLLRVKIDARNLISFIFEGGQATFRFRNVPKLSSVIVFHDTNSFSTMLRKFSSHIPKLESLMLQLTLVRENIIPTRFLNLKKLELMINSFQIGQALWSYIPIIQSSPNLLKLEMNWCYCVGLACDPFVEPKPFDPPHRFLEEVKLTGFTGTDHEIDVARYLITNTNALRMITVDCQLLMYSFKDGYFDFRGYTEEPDRNKIMKANQQLMNVVPSGAQLQFII
ncbi:hypothetical protein ACHQM5_021573 [Ranunculus cassubicifolius]